MTLIIYILVLGLLLFLLYLFGQRIIQFFSLISLLLFGTNKIGIYFYFLFFLPGVILHELAHLFMAIILGVPTGEITIFPQKEEKGWTLGQVKSAESDPLRNSLIGLAPMMVGVVSLVVISNLIFGNVFGHPEFSSGSLMEMLKLIQHDGFWQTIFFLYLILVFANTMALSAEDRKGVWALPIFIMIIFLLARALGLISFLSGKGVFNGLETGLSRVVESLILSFSLTVLVDFIFLLPLVFLTKVLLSFPRKRESGSSPSRG